MKFTGGGLALYVIFFWGGGGGGISPLPLLLPPKELPLSSSFLSSCRCKLSSGLLAKQSLTSLIGGHSAW